MKYNFKMYAFKLTLEDYMCQWTAAFYSGRIETADNLLAAVKRRDDFRGSLEVNMAEGGAQLHKNGLEPSEKSVHHWNEVKRYLEAETHACQHQPCRICCQKFSILTLVAFVTGAPRDAVDQTNRWLSLHEDDIMARCFRGQAWFGRGMELETGTGVGALDDLEVVGQVPEASEAIICFTRALEDLEIAGQLIQKLPDDRVYISKPLRREADDYFQQLKQTQFQQNFGSRATRTESDIDPFPFDPISIPADIFQRRLKDHIARTLVGLNRLKEALPLLTEGLQKARESGETELVLPMLYTLGWTLLNLKTPRKALPLLEEGLQMARDTGETEHIPSILYTLSWTLLNLKTPRKALPLLEEGLQMARDTGETEHILCVLYTLGWTLLDLKRQEEAYPLLEEGLKLARAFRDEGVICSILNMSVEALMKLERLDEAVPFLIEYLSLTRSQEKLQLSLLENLAVCLSGLKTPRAALPYLKTVFQSVHADKRNQRGLTYAAAIYLSTLQNSEDSLQFFKEFSQWVRSLDEDEKHQNSLIFDFGVLFSDLRHQAEAAAFLDGLREWASLQEVDLQKCVECFLSGYLKNKKFWRRG